ncbi:hypothetical protein [Maribacter halichondriae]|uniref:hypothetical protein n=1 Tax=Maribacter halichondriae TaxID=2980554 RepID=UPI00235861BF|nr:hypothetical protein [Maribacter sp. Hal144]
MKAERFILNGEEPNILEVPGGFANGFKAVSKGAQLIVFSNFSVARSQQDDYRYPLEQWSADW